MSEQGSPVVVVGGVGGSGTRLVAEIVQRLGVFIGRDLNSTLDNLWFTLLFRRPRWYGEQLHTDPHGQGVLRAIAWFEDAMLGRLQRSPDLEELVEAAGAELAAQGLDPGFVLLHQQRFLDAGHQEPPAGRWGWKEPNSHIYLEFLDAHFAGRLRYVHVMRHGLEVVRRRNRIQLANWGARFGISLTPEEGPDGMRLGTTAEALDYWIAANTRALAIGSQLGTRFHVLNVDRLRRDPAEEVRALCRFIEMEPAPDLLERIVAIPRPPQEFELSADDVNVLTDDRRSALASFGFEVPGST